MIKKDRYKIMTEERRKQARFRKTLKVFLCPTKYLLQTNALSRDISENGICLVSPYKIEIGETVKLGIARALLGTEQELRATFKTHKLLTVDSRQKERKKYGQKAARRKFQFVKR